MQETTETLFSTNKSTQPVAEYKKFNNWEFIPKGWVVVCESKKLKSGKTLSQKIYGHRLTLFRTKSGKASAVDSFCPHMGMDMAKGHVKGEKIVCRFHHWAFNTDGDCTDIPCLSHLPKTKKINLNSYPVEEKYGLIWVYTDRVADRAVYEVDLLKGEEVMFTHLKPFKRIAHPHITMMNSIDEQHMRTVHLLEIGLDLDIKTEGSKFSVDFNGKVERNNLMGKIQNIFMGDKWKSQVELIDGCVGILNIMLNSKLFNRFKLPSGHYIFSQSFNSKGETYVWPIIVTKRRKGILGFIFTKILLQFQKMLMWFLAYQDGRVIYGHLRFSSAGLIAGIDDTTSKWIAFVNRELKPSLWSKAPIEFT